MEALVTFSSLIKNTFVFVKEFLYSTPLIPLLILSLSKEKHSPEIATSIQSEYDYIIVGAGAGGSVVASRLSEIPCVSVLLLEAGKPPPILTEVPGLARLFWFTDIDWQFRTAPQKYTGNNLINRQVVWPSGKTLGGSTVLNAMLYVRGNRQNFDRWAEEGAHGWSYKDVYPYFLKLEDNRDPEYVANGFHNVHGPQTVHRPRYQAEFKDNIFRTIKDLGYSIVDRNAYGGVTGFYDHQALLRAGRRCSAAKSYLVPAGNRPNLDILPNAMVRKVLIENYRAVGVQFDHKGITYEIKARREVIMSAGTTNSAQLLMLSGIGPKEELKRHGIPVIADLPVGKNMQDHPGAFLPFNLSPKIQRFTEKVVNPLNIAQYIRNRTGPLGSTEFISVMAFLRNNVIRPETKVPDHELYFAEAQGEVAFQTGVTPEFFAQVFAPYLGRSGYICVSQLLNPRSRGTVTLQSTDPYDPPVIDPNYFEDPRDIDDIVHGLKTCMRIGRHPIMREVGSEPYRTLIPGCEQFAGNEDLYLPCTVRSAVVTFSHQVGTARMGDPNDPRTVVDPHLRVLKIKGLRVVDASIMPIVPSGNTNTPTLMVAEKASDIIKSTIKCNADHEDQWGEVPEPRWNNKPQYSQEKPNSNEKGTDAQKINVGEHFTQSEKPYRPFKDLEDGPWNDEFPESQWPNVYPDFELKKEEIPNGAQKMKKANKPFFNEFGTGKFLLNSARNISLFNSNRRKMPTKLSNSSPPLRPRSPKNPWITELTDSQEVNNSPEYGSRKRRITMTVPWNEAIQEPDLSKFTDITANLKSPQPETLLVVKPLNAHNYQVNEYSKPWSAELQNKKSVNDPSNIVRKNKVPDSVRWNEEIQTRNFSKMIDNSEDLSPKLFENQQMTKQKKPNNLLPLKSENQHSSYKNPKSNNWDSELTSSQFASTALKNTLRDKQVPGAVSWNQENQRPKFSKADISDLTSKLLQIQRIRNPESPNNLPRLNSENHHKNSKSNTWNTELTNSQSDNIPPKSQSRKKQIPSVVPWNDDIQNPNFSKMTDILEPTSKLLRDPKIPNLESEKNFPRINSETPYDVTNSNTWNLELTNNQPVSTPPKSKVRTKQPLSVVPWNEEIQTSNFSKSTNISEDLISKLLENQEMPTPEKESLINSENRYNDPNSNTRNSELTNYQPVGTPPKSKVRTKHAPSVVSWNEEIQTPNFPKSTDISEDLISKLLENQEIPKPESPNNFPRINPENQYKDPNSNTENPKLINNQPVSTLPKSKVRTKQVLSVVPWNEEIQTPNFSKETDISEDLITKLLENQQKSKSPNNLRLLKYANQHVSLKNPKSNPWNSELMNKSENVSPKRNLENRKTQKVVQWNEEIQKPIFSKMNGNATSSNIFENQKISKQESSNYSPSMKSRNPLNSQANTKSKQWKSELTNNKSNIGLGNKKALSNIAWNQKMQKPISSKITQHTPSIGSNTGKSFATKSFGNRLASKQKSPTPPLKSENLRNSYKMPNNNPSNAALTSIQSVNASSKNLLRNKEVPNVIPWNQEIRQPDHSKTVHTPGSQTVPQTNIEKPGYLHSQYKQPKNNNFWNSELIKSETIADPQKTGLRNNPSNNEDLPKTDISSTAVNTQILETLKNLTSKLAGNHQISQSDLFNNRSLLHPKNLISEKEQLQINQKLNKIQRFTQYLTEQLLNSMSTNSSTNSPKLESRADPTVLEDLKKSLETAAHDTDFCKYLLRSTQCKDNSCQKDKELSSYMHGFLCS